MLSWDESGAGDPIVFVHGLTEDRHSWDGAVARLAGRFRCVRVDLPGHGLSPDSDAYDPGTMAAALGDAVADAGIERPLLVGHSLGGAVVTMYAAGAPTTGVVNVDQPMRLGDFARAVQPLADGLRGDDFPSALAIVFGALGVDRVPAELRGRLEEQHRDARQDVVLGVWGQLFDVAPDDLTALVESGLRTLRVPYLAIHGGDPGDDYVMWLRNLMPQAVIEVWDGDGHYPHLVEPDRFAETVARFARDATAQT